MFNINIAVPNYEPQLDPFTGTWDDLVNEDGESLHFGKLSYTCDATSPTFRDSVKPRDVMTALKLLGCLKLEHHDVEADRSLLFAS